MSGVAEEVAKEAMRLAGHKLPIKVKFITRHDMPDHVEEAHLEETEAVLPQIVHEEEPTVEENQANGQAEEPAEAEDEEQE